MPESVAKDVAYLINAVSLHDISNGVLLSEVGNNDFWRFNDFVNNT